MNLFIDTRDNGYNEFILHNQKNHRNLDVSASFRAFIRRKLVLSSSGSWHEGCLSCQENGRTHGWFDSCPRHDSSFMACWPSLRICIASLIHLMGLSVYHCCLRPVNHMVFLRCVIGESWLMDRHRVPPSHQVDQGSYTAVRRVRIQKNWVRAFFWWRRLKEAEMSSFLWIFWLRNMNLL